VIESQKKKNNIQKKKTAKSFNNKTAIYVALGAAAICVVSFIILKNKK
jgi:hypothetical protein